MASLLCNRAALLNAKLLHGRCRTGALGLTALGLDGPYRLTIDHASGSIVEYFETVAAALLRQAELEVLLIAARTGAGSAGSR